jgi:hypothetical protein
LNVCCMSFLFHLQYFWFELSDHSSLSQRTLYYFKLLYYWNNVKLSFCLLDQLALLLERRKEAVKNGITEPVPPANYCPM